MRAVKSDKAAANASGCGATGRCAWLVCFCVVIVALLILVVGVSRTGPRLSPFARHAPLKAGADAPPSSATSASSSVSERAVTAAGARVPARSMQQMRALQNELRQTIQRVGAMQNQLQRAVATATGAAAAAATLVLPTAPPTQQPTQRPSLSFGSGAGADTRRQASVRAAIKHAWDGYARSCFGQDEVNTVTNACENWLNQGNTLIDSLDTLWIAGLRTEFQRARDWVAANAATVFSRAVQVSFFESTIRVLGGLLAAHHFSGDRMFVDRAADIGRRLAAAFETRSGIPHSSVNLATRQSSNPSWTSGASVLSEAGSVQLEFFYLSKLTGDDFFRDKAQRVVDQLDRMKKTDGLYPIYVQSDQDPPQFASSTITLGAMGDSWYEYLLKMWVQAGANSPRSPQYLRMYRESMTGVLKRLYRKADVSKQPAAGWAHLGDLTSGGFLAKMDHLVCFVSGLLALGVHRGAVAGSEAAEHLAAAKDLGATCARMYTFTASGVAPEFVNFGPDGSMHVGAAHNLLRPETAESMFILWRITKEQRWRDHGWAIFEAFEKRCRNANGYAGLENVNQPAPRQSSRQESFFIAETLKYLYLLFSDDALVPLDQFVFNTEAHPLPIFRD